LGYQIIAISPDAPASLKVTNDKEKLNYFIVRQYRRIIEIRGYCFSSPENYKANAKGSDGVNNFFARTGSVSFKCKY
jgi:peroxiredoxin